MEKEENLMNIEKHNAVKALKLTDLVSMEEAINYAKIFNDSQIWESVFGRSDFKKYLFQTLSVTEAISFASTVRCYIAHCDIMRSVLEQSNVQEYLLKTLSPPEAIAYANKVSDWQVWDIIIDRKDVREYLLKTLSSQEALDYGKEINEWPVWVIIFTRTDIDPETVITYATEVTYNNKIWETIFGRSDVVEYLLTNLSPSEVIDFALRVNYWRIWNYIFDNRRDLPLKKTMIKYSQREPQSGYGSDYEHFGNFEFGPHGLWRHLKEELLPEEALNFAKEVNYWKTWELVLSRIDIPFDSAVTHAKEISNQKVWGAVLSRSDISSAQALAWAKEIGNDHLWNTILSKV